MDMPLIDSKEWELVPFAKHPGHDSMWSLLSGTDGHIYIGLCQEHTGGGVAQLYRFNVGTRGLEHLADMAEVSGESADGTHAPQGKIHFSLCQTTDGRLFGATHCTTPPVGHTVWNPYGMWDDPVLGYPGGHIFRHDPRTGETLDFGIIFPNEGIPYLVLDESRNRLYGITYPKAHFFRVDLTGRNLVDYGRISSWYPIGMAFDRRGNLFTSDTNSRLIKYDVGQDRLVFFRSTPYANPWNRSNRFSWLCNLTLVEDGLIYGTHYSNDHLFRFDPAVEEPRFEDLGPGLPGVSRRLVRCLVPDGRGHVYYIVDTSVFVRYTIGTGTKENLGRLEIDGRSFCSWLGVTDHAGSIYMKGPLAPISLAVFKP